MPFDASLAESVLKRVFGFSSFRGQQLDAIRAVLAGHRDVLYIAATGSGKSLVYQFPTQYVRAASGGSRPRSMTLVISPLVSLMEDQAMAMRAAGVSVAALHSETLGVAGMWDRALRGEFDLLYITPEGAIARLDALARMHAAGLLDLIAIDEAHTVSEWVRRRPGRCALGGAWGQGPALCAYVPLGAPIAPPPTSHPSPRASTSALTSAACPCCASACPACPSSP